MKLPNFQNAAAMAGLERELAQLNLSNMHRQRRASFKVAAKNAWFKRNPELAQALGIYADHLLDSTVNDGLPELFIHYRELVISCRREDLVAWMLKDWNCRSVIHKHLERQAVFWDILLDTTHNSSDKRLHLVERLGAIIANAGLDYAYEKTSSTYYGDFLDFTDAFVVFIESLLKNQKDSAQKLPLGFTRLALGLGCFGTEKNLDECDLRESLDEYLRPLVETKTVRQIALEILEDRIASHLDDEDIKDFVLDFESAIVGMEEFEQFSLEELEDYNNV